MLECLAKSYSYLNTLNLELTSVWAQLGWSKRAISGRQMIWIGVNIDTWTSFLEIHVEYGLSINAVRASDGGSSGRGKGLLIVYTTITHF